MAVSSCWDGATLGRDAHTRGYSEYSSGFDLASTDKFSCACGHGHITLSSISISLTRPRVHGQRNVKILHTSPRRGSANMFVRSKNAIAERAGVRAVSSGVQCVHGVAVETRVAVGNDGLLWRARTRATRPSEPQPGEARSCDSPVVDLEPSLNTGDRISTKGAACVCVRTYVASTCCDPPVTAVSSPRRNLLAEDLRGIELSF
ncbi:hypothetical protein DAEQUDRAFT_463382 [Daedalea quercina L-15889]|uniref:Uncharacterized protein n=1 Tax=Daedalea quercina L-15889 TaxID=1314783 RepID=A0A165TEC8_9APHY|nr:hypothetical protein DAEQUDRAFT_463382 [Daedalea quercina L-15889]